MAGIRDAARQVLYSYHDHFFHMINKDEDRYYPRRHRGELVARIASTAREENDRMIPTMELLAMTNTKLNASLVEIKQLRQQQEEERRRITELEAQIA